MRPAYAISFLEMTKAPQTTKPAFEVLRASPIPVAYFRAIYSETGRKYGWIDQTTRPESDLKDYCADTRKEMVTLLFEGSPAGFFVLHHKAPIVEIAYFGLLEDAIGKGIGSQWLDFALHEAWGTQGVKKVITDTCTLDHPRALSLYLSKGFVITHREERPAKSQKD